MQDTPERNFWNWFLENETQLFEFDCGTDDERETSLARLSDALDQVSPDLTFELGPDQDGTRELVLSAGGIKSAFPAVEALALAAPSLPRWRVTKFRPRRNPIMQLNFAGETIDPAEVECCVLSNGEELGIYVFFPGYTEERHGDWGQIGYLLLDEALGEYDVETKVGLIEFLPFDSHPEFPRIPLTELSARFDQHYIRLQH